MDIKYLSPPVRRAIFSVLRQLETNNRSGQNPMFRRSNGDGEKNSNGGAIVSQAAGLIVVDIHHVSDGRRNCKLQM